MTNIRALLVASIVVAVASICAVIVNGSNVDSSRFQPVPKKGQWVRVFTDSLSDCNASVPGYGVGVQTFDSICLADPSRLGYSYSFECLTQREQKYLLMMTYQSSRCLGDYQVTRLKTGICEKEPSRGVSNYVRFDCTPL